MNPTKLLLTLYSLPILFSCSNSTSEEHELKNEDYFFCGAENFVDSGSEWYYDDGQGKFAAGGTQFKAFAFEGNSCILLDSIKPYGLSKKFFNLVSGNYFEASVWIKEPVGRATLIAAMNGKSNYSIHTNDIHKTESKNGWSHYFLSFGIEAPVDTMSIFAFSGNETHYFDNMEINFFTKRPDLNDTLYDQALRLYIPDSNKILLDGFKQNALMNQLITSDDKKYVGGFILGTNQDSTPIEIRLKGDWTDHIESGKTSFRIKAENAFEGLVTFSIQHPQTRNYMHEWFMHKWCDKEGLLSTTYNFLPVIINDENQGIYAIEEHFDKQLIESRQLREGPIVKFDESGFWALLASGKKEELNGSYPYFESSKVTCFKAGRTEKNPVLSNQFENAANLMYLLKNRYAHPDQILNMQAIAKFYAMMDVGNVMHSLAWHNRRYYYNPVTTKLELIGFDMIPAIMPYNSSFALLKILAADFPQEDESTIDHFLLLNQDFKSNYLHYLKQFTSKNYLDSLFSSMKNEINQTENLLSVEFPNYKLDTSFYYQKAAYLRNEIETLEKVWMGFEKNYSNKLPDILPPNYPELKSDFYLEEVSVNAYRKTIDSTQYLLQIENYHLSNVTIVGYGTKNGKDTVFMLDKPVLLMRYDGIKNPSYQEITLTKKPSKIYFTVDNLPGVMHNKKVDSWQKPTGYHPRIELENAFKPNAKYYDVKEDTLFFKKGNTTIDQLIYIPSKYVVVFEAGAHINLINKAGLIINNSTYFNGTESENVLIYSTDTSSQGITILNPWNVIVNHTKMTGLGMLNHKGWKLTGAFTVYQGNTIINNLEIEHNTCEDALNIIRGFFDVNNLHIHHTFGDAFDADFCNGNIANAKFEFTGNDCIDFSGSEVIITDVTIYHSGDKGISSGEQSNLIANNITIDGALTAVASKDGSRLTVTNGFAKNCEVGAALYKKKPEYPTSYMSLSKIIWEDIDQITLLELGSSLKYENYYYTGSTYFDIDSMYARFSK